VKRWWSLQRFKRMLFRFWSFCNVYVLMKL